MHNIIRRDDIFLVFLFWNNRLQTKKSPYKIKIEIYNPITYENAWQ